MSRDHTQTRRTTATAKRYSPFGKAVDQELTEVGRGRILRTEKVTYPNPLNINFNFDVTGIARVLEIVRDWGPARRAAIARVRIEEARASSYEDDLQFKRDIHNTIRTALVSQDLHVGHDELAALLTAKVQRSLESSLRPGPDIEVELDADGAA
jgi:hypothetical protein